MPNYLPLPLEKVYTDARPISNYIIPEKQAAKRHYGSHQYFTKRAWNVIQQYIERFTEPGDVVCDPYGGSGVTVVEALVLGRKGIYLDISNWATFLAEQIALTPIDIGELSDAFAKVEKACAKKINAWQEMDREEVEKVPLDRPYPQGHPLPKNADVRDVESLFTHRQLLQLSELYHHILRTKDDVCRDLLRYAFSATLYKCNRTFISAKGRKESRGGSSIFSVFRYKVAKATIELSPWPAFDRAVKNLIVAKRETNNLIGQHPGGSSNARFIKGYAQNLSEHVEPESVDYIFTDPPYGAHIAYLDLTRMWDAWLGFETTDLDRQEEAIENGDEKHSPAHYKRKLADGIAEMFKALKYDRWMSIVFAHREPAMWDTIVKAAEAAGFEYVNTVPQPLKVVWSMHKKKRPLTVLSGELILNFKKVSNPKTLAITSAGVDAVSLIKDSAELSIVQNGGGATVDQIHNDLIPKLLESGLLGTVSGKIGDITPILNTEFTYDASSGTFHVKPGRKLGCHIPMEQRIKFYVIDYLNQAERLRIRATIDDIVMHLLPKLKNGVQPQKQKVIEEIKKIAKPVDGKYWTRWENPQMVFDFAHEDLTPKPTEKVSRKPEEEYEHNEMLYLLVNLGQSAGFGCYIGKKEQAGGWQDHKFADLSAKSPGFLRGAAAFTKGKVEQIDLLWLDAKRPALSFEIEHSTPITTGLDRFIELLKVDASSAERMVIVAPKRRQKKMDQVLGSSHYIGAPMYLETKVRYLWYSQVLSIADRFANEQPTKTSLLEAMLHILNHPKAKPS